MEIIQDGKKIDEVNILAVDIGNSDIVFGIWKDQEWRHIWRNPSVGLRQSEVYVETHIRNEFLEEDVMISEIDRVMISSVVPDLSAPLSRVLHNIFAAPVHLIGPEQYIKNGIIVDRPHEIGTDLACNAFAASSIYDHDAIIVDFGTALTFTTVKQGCRIIGVAIAPGIGLAIKTLSAGTAQLPEVPLILPDSLLGQNTEHAIQAGVLWGYVGMVKEILARLKSELGEHYITIATGGLSSVLEPLHDEFTYINKNLTLEGIRRIAPS